jgi:carbonic anhydrase
VGTGRIEWLNQAKAENILHEVEADPNRAMNAMAPAAHSETEKSAPKKSAPKKETQKTQHS